MPILMNMFYHRHAWSWAHVDVNIDFLQIPMQIIFLGWMTMAEILDNPFGYNMEYDVNLAEVRRFVTIGQGGRGREI